MISTAVVLYQLLFVGILYIASKLGGILLRVALVACLLWTATHLFFVPLAVLQTVVIVGSYLVFNARRTRRKALERPNA